MKVDKQCIAVEYDHIGRVYVFNDGDRYHSVTTMLGATADKSNIEIWKNRVGQVQAERDVLIAAHLGEQFHLLGEHYLNGTNCPPMNPISTQIFNTSTRHILDAHVTDVVSVEEALYSEKYRIAGRTDGIVGWDRKLTVLDYKLLNNSDPRWLKDYWIQATIYAHCWKEMYDEMPEQLVLVVGNKNTLDTEYFVSKVKPHIKDMNYRFYKFHAMVDDKE